MSLFISREIDFVKKEEELKKSLDEKDKWYKEQLESLQKRVGPRFGEKIRKCLYSTAELQQTLTRRFVVLSTDSCPGVWRNLGWGVSEWSELGGRREIKLPRLGHKHTIC